MSTPANAIATPVREAAIADYVTGSSVTDAAARHGVSAKSLARWITAEGVARPRGPRAPSTPAETRDLAVAMYRDGASSTAVGAAFGVSASSVTAWARAAGVPIRKPGWRRRVIEPEPIHFEGRWVRRGLIHYPIQEEEAS